MSRPLNARLPLRVEQKLAEYCARRGGTRTTVVVQALDRFLDNHTGGSDAYALAADPIPRRGAAKLQSGAVRKLARSAFRGGRTR